MPDIIRQVIFRRKGREGMIAPTKYRGFGPGHRRQTIGAVADHSYFPPPLVKQ